MKRFVIIIYTVKGSDTQVRESIKLTGDWCNYFPGSWLVLTRVSVQDIYNRIATNAAGDRFLVMEVTLNSYYGILPTEAWDWIKAKKAEQGQW